MHDKIKLNLYAKECLKFKSEWWIFLAKFFQKCEERDTEQQQSVQEVIVQFWVSVKQQTSKYKVNNYKLKIK